MDVLEIRGGDEGDYFSIWDIFTYNFFKLIILLSSGEHSIAIAQEYFHIFCIQAAANKEQRQKSRENPFFLPSFLKWQPHNVTLLVAELVGET